MAIPSAQFLRVELPHESGALGNVTAAITEAGGAIVPVDTVGAHGHGTLREVSRQVARAVAEEAERAGPVRESTTDTAEPSTPGR